MVETQRYLELKTILESRRAELMVNVRDKMRSVRINGSERHNSRPSREVLENAELNVQEDIELKLVQMQTETLVKINNALTRLEYGNYGNCDECGKDIAEKRLRALPFAARCRACEEAKEIVEQRVAARRCRAEYGLFYWDEDKPE